MLQVEARAAADRIQTFTDGIRDQLGWMVQFPWTQGEDDRRRVDGLRLLQQVPAIVSVSLVDPTGTERVFVSRVSLNRTGRGADLSDDPAVAGGTREPGLVRPRAISARFRALYEDRRRGKPRGRRRSSLPTSI